MPNVFTDRRRVEFHETDAAGIVHFACYFLWMEQAEHAFWRSLGLSVMLEWEGERVSWPRVAAKCNFLRPVRFEDVVDIAVRVARIGNSSVTYQIDFSHVGEPIAEGTTTAVFCRMMPPPEPPRAEALPAALRAVLAPYAEAEQ